ncbi:MAG: hypothetical protein HY063_09975 [Bacteroidetes bacterium]|nr:hypothetical protein [Bacteroidota bacterium]
MKKIIFILLFMSEFGAFAQSQSEIDAAKNLRKYWYYRYRFLNDYILVDDCQGCSLPASVRALGATSPQSSTNSEQFVESTKQLGMYLGVLATEYALLKQSNQDASETVKELYYALKAFNRLDETAESYWRCPTCPANPQNSAVSSDAFPQTDGDLNGFFLREDVASDFLSNNYVHFNQGITSSSIASVGRFFFYRQCPRSCR